MPFLIMKTFSTSFILNFFIKKSVEINYDVYSNAAELFMAVLYTPELLNIDFFLNN